jgi:hypothetical protein
MKQSGHQKDKKVHRVIKHIEKKFVAGKNIVTDESTAEFKHKIIFKTLTQKTNEVGRQIIFIN